MPGPAFRVGVRGLGAVRRVLEAAAARADRRTG